MMLKSKVILPTTLTILFTALAIILYLNSDFTTHDSSGSISPRREIHFLYQQMSDLAELIDFSTDVLQIHVLDSRVKNLNIAPTKEEDREHLLQMGYDPEDVEIMLSGVSFAPLYEVVTSTQFRFLKSFKVN